MVLALAFGAGLTLYPWFTTRLARSGAGQRVQAYNPTTHRIKIGTPTMGGLLFCGITAVAWLVFDRTRVGFVVVFALGAGALLGLLDDRDNIRGRGVFGLPAYEKIAFQAFIGLLVGIGLDVVDATRQYIPGLGAPDLHGAGIIAVSILAVIAVSNAVNLTDGVDGLAASCSAVVFAGLLAVAVHQHALPVVIVSAALVGALAAFLVFNWFPARLFMGDTGSLGLGGAIGGLAVMTQTEVLLIIIGGIFVIEALSVAIQVFAFKTFRRRVLLMAPLHHHFEMLAWSETKIMLRFWIIAAVCSGIGFTLYQQSIGR